jgi:hypothetical protein
MKSGDPLNCSQPYVELSSFNVESFLGSADDAVIFAGPGWGKSTFLHYTYRRYLDSSNVFPVLVTLRRPTAVDDLSRFVETVEKIAKRRK